MMASLANNRLKKELENIKSIKQKQYRLDGINEKELSHWTAVLLPDRAPYNVGAYKVSLDFPNDFPFKAPKVKFVTKVYHPNISEDGDVRFPMISAENWKPSVNVDQVLTALVDMLCSPQLDCPLRKELAELFLCDPTTFEKNAADFCKQYAEKR